MDVHSYKEAIKQAAAARVYFDGRLCSDFMTILGDSSFFEYEQDCSDVNDDLRACYQLIDAKVPGTVPDGAPDTIATKAERIRLALIAGKLTESQAFKLLALVAATVVIEAKAAVYNELYYLHDVVCGITDGEPEMVYSLSNEDHVTRLARAYLTQIKS